MISVRIDPIANGFVSARRRAHKKTPRRRLPFAEAFWSHVCLTQWSTFIK
ncbi:hypothetical protein RB7523 [Rhodopirellula baltica SH 1]|uniref:Uncharacterized protein n=1 Tax=Rhodopirellula baltica (strain DSM 10527 / NCIMB 13988 / SH1) TaxID=243090 RepID=Q7UNL0_RHOBA|nr:hypothetical protein RB7523 [Rhodopirellula baltica SH 1]